jgi:hypothetical protein
MSYDDGSNDLIMELTKVVANLRDENKKLKQELEARDKLPVPKSVVKQFLEMQGIIQKYESDLAYYKKHVPNKIIINREHKHNPNNRKGGIPK